MSRARLAPLAVALLGALGARALDAQAPALSCLTSSAHRQSPADAWWTGPMLANSAATLPRGHALVETYLYDVAVRGRIDARGRRQDVPRAHGFGTQTYAIYGLADRLSAGLIPSAGFNRPSDGRSSSRVGWGDIGAMGQFRIAQEDRCGWMPTLSVNLQENFPTGKYDDLGDRPSDGMGGGAYTTTVSLYAQKSTWLPNGRILRMRLDVSQGFSSRARVDGVSVYGTGAGFRGHATPGPSTYVDASWEYSMTRRWVLALDGIYRHGGDTRVVGRDAAGDEVALRSGSSDAFGVAPAVEYSWTANIGALVGARVIAVGRNTAITVSPAVALNVVR